jgi:DNA-binding transcriptional ArsR family regulator
MNNFNFAELTPARFSLLAEAVSEALSANKCAKLSEAHEHLSELLRGGLETVPAEVRRAIRDKDFAAPERQAYALGQIAFAQTLVGQTLTRRADDTFLDKLHLPRLKAYVDALSKREMTNSELAEAVGENVATVCRKLRELREYGIATFVRRGANVVNFLTPLAQDAYTPSDTIDHGVSEMIQRRGSALPGHLRGLVDFGAKVSEPALT